jgi:hypothetical protein
MPTTLSGSESGRLWRLTTRSRVSLLTGGISRFAKHCRRSATERQTEVMDDAVNKRKLRW